MARDQRGRLEKHRSHDGATSDTRFTPRCPGAPALGSSNGRTPLFVRGDAAAGNPVHSLGHRRPFRSAHVVSLRRVVDSHRGSPSGCSTTRDLISRSSHRTAPHSSATFPVSSSELEPITACNRRVFECHDVSPGAGVPRLNYGGTLVVFMFDSTPSPRGVPDSRSRVVRIHLDRRRTDSNRDFRPGYRSGACQGR